MYDPFLSAKKQLEELFSPTTQNAPTTQMINSMMSTPTSNSNVLNKNKNLSNNNGSASKSNDIMSKSLTSQAFSPKTPQPIPKMQSNFRRTSSLRVSNRKPKPSIYTPPTKSNVHCGISPDDGPISPNFVRATDYDELPIKSPYSAIKMCEQASTSNVPQQIPVRASPSPTLPVVNNINSNSNFNSNNIKPLLRPKDSALIRKTLKLDIKNPNMPSNDYPLSKTDSLALFLKYENELTSQMSEKELKDKSNSLSKRSATLNSSYGKDQKLPDINGKPHQLLHMQKISPHLGINEKQCELISVDKLNMSGNDTTDGSKSHSAPVKLINACDNLPHLNNNNNVNNNNNNSDTSRSPSLDRREDSPDKGNSTSNRALRRKMKYNMDNILFDTDPEVKSTPNSSDNSNNNSLIRPESRASNAESIFEDFDFDQFIASFTDDEKFPIFKDYKMLLNNKPKSSNNNNINNNNKDEENNNSISMQNNERKSSTPPRDDSIKAVVNEMNSQNSPSKPIPIQQQKSVQSPRDDNQISGMEKLDNLCKMLAGNSDSDESNSCETDPQTSRSKSSADSAYGRYDNL
jgi:hypothetical protein